VPAAKDTVDILRMLAEAVSLLVVEAHSSNSLVEILHLYLLLPALYQSPLV